MTYTAKLRPVGTGGGGEGDRRAHIAKTTRFMTRLQRRAVGTQTQVRDHTMSEVCPMLRGARTTGLAGVSYGYAVGPQRSGWLTVWRFPWRASASTTLRFSVLKFLTSSVISVPQSM